MKTKITDFFEFQKAICGEDLVFMFGSGISAALTGINYGWYHWIRDGINTLTDSALSSLLQSELEAADTAADLIAVVGKVLETTKNADTYDAWMHKAFETAQVTNADLAHTLHRERTSGLRNHHRDS